MKLTSEQKGRTSLGSRHVEPLVSFESGYGFSMLKEYEEGQCDWRVMRKRKKRVRWVRKVGTVAPVGLCKPR